MIGFPATAFARRWGAPILAGLLALGLGLGFWLYVGAITDARQKAETELAAARDELDALEAQGLKDARALGYFTARLDAEANLAQKRSLAEQSRSTGADVRLRSLEGSLNALRTDLSGGLVPCGSGADVLDRMRDARASRETDLLSRNK
jgi:uncharacterized protein (DUF2164 family)